MLKARKNIVANGERIYQKIESYLDDLIKQGTLKAGDRLISERELGKMFKASTIPVRRAMQKFIDDGILEKVHGKGTFVKRTVVVPAATNRIAVFHCHSKEGFFSSPFYSAIMGGIDLVAQAEKKNIIMRSLVRDVNEEPIEAFRELEDEVDGYILVDLSPSVYRSLRRHMPGLKKPAVLLNAEYQDLGVDSVVTDSRGNTRMLVRHLINCGHRNIALVFGHHEPTIHPNFMNRMMAFKETLIENGIEPSENMLINVTSVLDKDNLEKRLTSPGRPTALYCTGGYQASRQVYPLAEKLGLRIPDDLSVTCYDDDREVKALIPRITTVDTGLVKMGSRGLARLLEKKGKTDGDHYQIILPGTMVRGKSVADISKEKQQ